jgi:hypothetical protein
LTFDRHLLLRAVALVEKNGDRATLLFGQIRRNQPLPPRAFETNAQN